MGSNITPRLRAWVEGETGVPSMVSVRLGFLLRVDLELMRRSTVLLLLSLRKLCCIQVVVAENLTKGEDVDDEEKGAEY